MMIDDGHGTIWDHPPLFLGVSSRFSGHQPLTFPPGSTARRPNPRAPKAPRWSSAILTASTRSCRRPRTPSPKWRRAKVSRNAWKSFPTIATGIFHDFLCKMDFFGCFGDVEGYTWMFHVVVLKQIVFFYKET